MITTTPKFIAGMLFVVVGAVGLVTTLALGYRAKRLEKSISRQALIFAIGTGITWTIAPIPTLIALGALSKTFLTIWLLNAAFMIPALYACLLLIFKMKAKMDAKKNKST